MTPPINCTESVTLSSSTLKNVTFSIICHKKLLANIVSKGSVIVFKINVFDPWQGKWIYRKSMITGLFLIKIGPLSIFRYSLKFQFWPSHSVEKFTRYVELIPRLVCRYWKWRYTFL